MFSELKLEKKSLSLWKKLSQSQQEQFGREHPSYDLKNNKTLAREFFSYTFENHLQEVTAFAKGKYEKASEASKFIEKNKLFLKSNQLGEVSKSKK